MLTEASGRGQQIRSSVKKPNANRVIGHQFDSGQEIDELLTVQLNIIVTNRNVSYQQSKC